MAIQEAVTANIVASTTSVLQLVKAIGSMIGGAPMPSCECILTKLRFISSYDSSSK